MAKIVLHASVLESEWRDKFLANGIKAGDIEGEANNQPAILVQSREFPLDSWDRITHMRVVTFEKDLGEVFVDWDDDVEAWDVIEKAGHKYGEKGLTYGDVVKDASELDDYLLYGAFVKEIKPDEIKNIRKARFSSVDEDIDFEIYENGKWMSKWASSRSDLRKP